MEILKNSRQMPKKKEIMSDKMYSDILYGWLQVNSYCSGKNEVRWIPKKEIKFTEIAKALGLSRQTVSTRFKKLQNTFKDDVQLIRYNEELQRYELPILDRKMGMLIEAGTLQEMVASLSENTINVYIYLFNRYWANDCQGFQFTLDQLKDAIGISVESHSNNYIIFAVLKVLVGLRLLEYTSEEVRDPVKDIMKTVYKVTKMRNELPKVPESC